VESALRDNGGLRVSHDLVRRWAGQGVDVLLLVLENVAPGLPMLAPAADVPWVYASSRVRRFRSALPRVLLGLLRCVRRCDVVVSGSEVGWGLLLGWAVGRLLRRDVVVLVQAPLDRAVGEWRPAPLRPLLRWVHRRVDRAVCVSPGLAGPVLANGLPADRVVVLPVGIDVDDVIRRGAGPLPALPGPDGVPLLVAIGRLTPAKGFDLLIEASARVARQGLAHRLVIVGDGPDRAGLQARIDAAGAGGTIRLAGFLADPQPLLARADLFVLSSRFEGNGGLVLLEALAHGRPVVAADCDFGPREVLRDGALGDLVPAEDVEGLAGALGVFLRSPDRLRRLATAGPDRARDFDQAACAERILRFLTARSARR